VLVTGESGTGKDLVARALHREGRQREGRFVVVDCSSVVDSTFDVELFGRAAAGGADARPGLFEHAEGGTLFLDDIGELPRHVQPRLLRAVEHGEIQRVGSPEPHPVDVCVMAASTHDLQDDVAKGRLRQDLFYRLGAIEVHVPSLRERREDVALLAAAFIRELSHRFERSITGLSHVAERLLQAEAWPGNVRELRAVLERACIESPGGLLTEREITAALSRTRAPHEGTLPSDDADAAWDPDKLSTAQREQIRRVLAETSGNKAAAAKLLGISRRSLYRWLDRLDLPL
jgi:DNA-binding NtrC family response regulator